jgi:hypothetical protein
MPENNSESNDGGLSDALMKMIAPGILGAGAGGGLSYLLSSSGKKRYGETKSERAKRNIRDALVGAGLGAGLGAGGAHVVDRLTNGDDEDGGVLDKALSVGWNTVMPASLAIGGEKYLTGRNRNAVFETLAANGIIDIDPGKVDVGRQVKGIRNTPELVQKMVKTMRTNQMSDSTIKNHLSDLGLSSDYADPSRNLGDIKSKLRKGKSLGNAAEIVRRSGRLFPGLVAGLTLKGLTNDAMYGDPKLPYLGIDF